MRMMQPSDEIFEASTSSSSCKMQKVSEIEHGDRISSLPDPLLAHILSFLPTEDAVKTVLLRIFGHLWTSIQNLDFNVWLYNSLSITHPKDWRFLNFVDHVLLLHESPTIVKFCLNFGHAFYGKQYTDKVNSWIHFAMKKKVKVLKLDILGGSLYDPLINYYLPDYVLMSDYLTKLKLGGCGLKTQGQIHMRSLKTLYLRKITLNDNLIEEILSGCPSLENLSLIRCYGLNKLNLISACLKNLRITLGGAEMSTLEMCCPNLKSLNILGAIWRANLKNSLSLVDATLDFYCGATYSNDEYRNVGMLLEELSHAKFLTVCNWCILVLALFELENLGCSSSNRKCIVLKTMLTKWHLLGIASLLRNSPSLEMLTIYIEPGTSVLTSDNVMWLEALEIHQNNCWNDEIWLRSFDFDGENYWNSQQPFHCLTNHLKTVKIHGCISNPLVIQLVKFLLRSSAVLEKVVISTNGNAQPNQQRDFPSEVLLKFSQELLSSSKASNHAVILFS